MTILHSNTIIDSTYLSGTYSYSDTLFVIVIFTNHETKELFVLTANRSLVGTFKMTISDETRSTVFRYKIV